MFAKSNVKCGDILLTEKPFVYVLSSKLRTEHCDYCFSKGELLKCSSCRYVYYCGKVCQRDAWSMHKMECNNLKKVAPRVVPDAARFIARLVWKLNSGGSSVRSYYAEDKFRTFKDLMSHYSDIKMDKRRMEHFTSLCAVLFELLDGDFLPNSAELMAIYGRMCINSFNICDVELKSLGIGMYLGASIIDHSCEPNAVVTFEGTTIHVRSLIDLNTINWSKVFISYIETLNVLENRQEELLEQYYFLCQCPRCLDVTNLHFMNGAKCTSKDCGGCIDMNANNNQFKCDTCSKEVDKEFADCFREIEQFCKESLQKMKELPYLDLCRVCLRKQEEYFYKLNVQRIKLLDYAFESCIEYNLWDEAKSYGVKLINGFQYYYNYYHPLAGLLYLKLAKISSLLEEPKEAILYLKKAFDILKVTHGINSSIFKCTIKPLMEQLAFETS